MKKMIFLVLLMTTAITAHSMNYNTAREEALFLSDKMAYELGLSDAQYESVYRINLDYLLHMTSHRDLHGRWWDVRNRDLRLVLSHPQYARFISINYFYRPLSWHSGRWYFPIYDRYAHGRMLRHHPHPSAPHHAAPHGHGAPGHHHGTPHGGSHHHSHSRR
ncbi:MAG: hypothetical protein J5529_01050 [Prevotella sp.]|jgi:hypothetical protein|nr:hypothetical protein [Prevotella sp.]